MRRLFLRPALHCALAVLARLLGASARAGAELAVDKLNKKIDDFALADAALNSVADVRFVCPGAHPRIYPDCATAGGRRVSIRCGEWMMLLVRHAVAADLPAPFARSEGESRAWMKKPVKPSITLVKAGVKATGASR